MAEPKQELDALEVSAAELAALENAPRPPKKKRTKESKDGKPRDELGQFALKKKCQPE